MREHWQIDYAAVQVSTNNSEAVCSIYIGTTPVSSQFVSQTQVGSSGDTCEMGGHDIQPGQYVIAKWVGGDAGATATLTVSGNKTVGSPQR
jgi:hypothetical protein